jgi:hypothetical protein
MMRELEKPVRIPKGHSAVSRYFNYLKSVSETFARIVSEYPDAVKYDVEFRWEPRKSYRFDGYVHVRRRLARVLAGLLGIGAGAKEPRHGYALFLKWFKSPPKMKDLKLIEEAVRSNVLETGTAPTKIVILWSMNPQVDDFMDGLSDEVYDYILNHTFEIKIGLRKYTSHFELVIEQLDNTYDFIPFVAEL